MGENLKKDIDPQEVNNDSRFDAKRRIIGAICGPICAFLVYITPISGLTPQAHTLLAVMTLVALWWITEPIPIPVTSLLGPTLQYPYSTRLPTPCRL